MNGEEEKMKGNGGTEKEKTTKEKKKRIKRDIPPHIDENSLTPRSLKKLKKNRKVTGTPLEGEEGITSAEVVREDQIPTKKKDKKRKEGLEELLTGTAVVKSPTKKRKTPSAQEDITAPTSKRRKNKHPDSTIPLARLSHDTPNPTSTTTSIPMTSTTLINQSTNPMSSTPNTTFTTRNGTTLTLNNAGTYLLWWGHAVGYDNLKTTHHDIPSPSPSLSKPIVSNTLQRKLDTAKLEGRALPTQEIPTHQASLRACSIELPGVGIVHSAQTREGGWPNKKLAKQSASFEAIRYLYEVGRLDDDLKAIISSSSSNSEISTESTTCTSVSINTDPGISTPDQHLSTGEMNADVHQRDEENRSIREIRLSIKSRSTLRWDEQKRLIKERLPPSASESSLIPTGQFGLGKYESYVSPPFWAESPPLHPDSLYATTLELVVSSPHQKNYRIDEICRKMCLITSRPLDIFGNEHGTIDLNLTVGDQQLPDTLRSKFRMVDYGRLRKWSGENFDKALGFTERLLRAELQKPFKGGLEDVKWLLVPLKADFNYGLSSEKHKKRKKGGKRKLSEKDISWDEITRIVDGPINTSIYMDDLDILKTQCHDRMITSPSEFSKRSYINKVRFDLNPSSPHPLIPGKTILESLPLIARLGYTKQPILEVESTTPYKSGGIINSLTYPLKSEINYVIPELTKLHCIPSSIYRTGTVLPCLMDELDSILIANHLNTKILGGAVDPKLMVQALTSPNSNAGLSKNYERLEFLGDTLLKFVVTIHQHLFESKSTLKNINLDRHVITSNRSLAHNALGVGLHRYIRTKRFRAKEWLPRDWILNWAELMGEADKGKSQMSFNAKLRGLRSEDVLGVNEVGDKVLADVLEAVIGASYLTSRDLDDVLAVSQALGIPIKGLNTWSDLKYLVPPPSSTTTTVKPGAKTEEANYLKVFKAKKNIILGYEFKDESMMNTILSLDMNAPGRKDTFDRYRLLGNAILDYLVVEYLFDKYPEEGPSALHLMKASRCTEGARSALSAELGLLDLLRNGTNETQVRITKIRKALKAAKAKNDALRSRTSEGGSEGPNVEVGLGLEYWAEVSTSLVTSEPLEALFGAILHDSSFDLNPVRKLFEDRVSPFLEKYGCPPRSWESDPKVELLQFLQSKGCGITNLLIERNHITPLPPPVSAQGKEGEGEEEVIVTFHGVEVARERVEVGLGFKAVKRCCAFTLNYLKVQGGFERLCDCSMGK
ncbi:hypothetical protein I302_104313 [Kwoniella bestiolae CBS 10118]|uniref:RNase III domain-containing protein n=1 Tax=Kwoniella bestiolae CBS 10118 TaxID=1296100 RepID=A0A1B9GAX8_9TREE|nr:hypothetical protein I302_03021 [Kwoniella bestiolae CBS 10118]OCF28170.1 hypothetical protein I302_03021 [Kwoniella bestiolae CBS 10118]